VQQLQGKGFLILTYFSVLKEKFTAVKWKVHEEINLSQAILYTYYRKILVFHNQMFYDPRNLCSTIYAVADLLTVHDFQPKFPVLSLPDAVCLDA
jgi:hypothetical protein